MNELIISCEYCTGQDELIKATVPDHVSAIKWRQAWKQNAPKFKRITCGTCGGTFEMEDDGVAAESGGLVVRKNVSTPAIQSLNVSTGPREGGNVLIVTGNRLEVGALVVKFDGKPAPTVDERTITTARVVVPQGCYRLNVLEHLHVLTLTITSGALVLNEAVTTDGGSVGVIRHIDGSTYMVVFQTLVETPAAMVGTSLIGGGTGGTADIDAADLLAFTDGEQVLGLSSGAYGVARGGTLLTVDNPTTSYASDELVKGETSGAMVKLTGSPAYSGLVDVTVENEHGQRVDGTLIGVYTYA